MKKITFNKWFFILILLFISCQSQETSQQEEIEVIYISGFGEMDTSISPTQFPMKKVEPSDTIHLTTSEFDAVKNYIHSAIAKRHSDSVDVRMAISMDTTKVFLGLYHYGYHACDSIKNVEYLVKKKTGYYNHIKSEILQSTWFEEIKKYGIPEDYHFIIIPRQQIDKELYHYILMKNETHI